MRNLLNKELKLTISPFFYFLPVIMGVLMLIPNWLYFLVFMYFCFITAPNILSGCKASNDLSFSILLPVRKDDIVLSRILSFSLLELMHVAAGAVFAIINGMLFGKALLFLTPNVAFFGLVFVIYGVYNLVLFPIFYKSAYKYGTAVIVSTVVVVLLSGGMEMLALLNKEINSFMRNPSAGHYVVLAVGILFFILSNYIAYRVSAVRFRKVDA